MLAEGLDFALLLLPALGFGLFVTVHVALSALLAFRRPHWRGLLAFIVPPLAPYWGWGAGLHVWSGVWLFALVFYVIGLFAANVASGA